MAVTEEPGCIVEGSLARADHGPDVGIARAPATGPPGLRRSSGTPRPTQHVGSARRWDASLRETLALRPCERIAGGEGRARLHAAGWRANRPASSRHHRSMDVHRAALRACGSTSRRNPWLRHSPQCPSRSSSTSARTSACSGLDALQRYPGARVIAYEPDAESAAIHRRLSSATRPSAGQDSSRPRRAPRRHGHVPSRSGNREPHRRRPDARRGDTSHGRRSCRVRGRGSRQARHRGRRMGAARRIRRFGTALLSYS